VLLLLRRQLILLRTVHCQPHYFLHAAHLLEGDALLLLRLLHEDVAGDEGERSALVAVPPRSAHAVNVRSCAHFSLSLRGLAVVNNESDRADVDSAADGLSAQQDLYFLVAQHGDSGGFGG